MRKETANRLLETSLKMRKLVMDKWKDDERIVWDWLNAVHEAENESEED